jgi:hypothetical protein
VPRWLPFAVVAIPALLLVIQLVPNWVYIPYWDEWRVIAHLRIAMATGSCGLSVFWLGITTAGSSGPYSSFCVPVRSSPNQEKLSRAQRF